MKNVRPFVEPNALLKLAADAVDPEATLYLAVDSLSDPSLESLSACAFEAPS